MKYYWWVLPLALCVPQAWGADAGCVPYHVETVAGSSRIGDGGPPLAAQFSNIQGLPTIASATSTSPTPTITACAKSPAA